MSASPAITSAPPVWHFAITARITGQLVGHAVVCPATRYASVRWLVASRIDRCHAGRADWDAVGADLAHQTPSRLVDEGSATESLLLPAALRAACTLQLLTRPVIDAPRRGALTHALDEYLWAQVAVRSTSGRPDPDQPAR